MLMLLHPSYMTIKYQHFHELHFKYSISSIVICRMSYHITKQDILPYEYSL